MLPGSGTSEIVNLSKSSNIGKPGQWLYRIDSNDMQMCLQPHLQPPYCEEIDVTDNSVPVTSPTRKSFYFFLQHLLVQLLLHFNTC